MTGDDTMVSAGLICFNTNLAAALATVAALIVSWVRYGKPDVSLTFNGALAGLVAITAGCDVVDPFGAAVIGIVAGVLCIFSVEFFDNIAKIDDPVGAVSVHCMNGAVGHTGGRSVCHRWRPVLRRRFCQAGHPVAGCCQRGGLGSGHDDHHLYHHQKDNRPARF